MENQRGWPVTHLRYKKGLTISVNLSIRHFYMALSAFDEIKKHEASIAALKTDAISALKAERAALEKQAQAIASLIAQLTGRAPEAPSRRNRRPLVAEST